MAMGAESSATPCRACMRPINDRYIMRVGDTSYHETCLVCSVCSIRLSSTCHTRDCKLFCRLDYERLYGKKCLGCSESVSPSELVMRAVDSVFHLRCFLCVVCGGRLQKGDQFVVKQGQLFCRPDYEKEVEMFQSHSQVAGEEIIAARPTDGRRGPKRPRTILTTQQRRAFKASFEISPKPCRKVREGLAKDTGLSVRIVQVWFQNQRAKMKKIQKKARLDSKNSASNGNNSSEGDSMDDKKEKIKDDEPNSCYFGDSCSDTEGVQDYRSSAGEYLPMKEECVEKEEKAFYRSILSQPHGSHFDQSPDRLRATKIEADTLLSCSAETYRGVSGGGSIRILQGVPPHVCPPLYGLEAPITPTPMSNSNPIDRLYSMQSSYFCSEQISE